MPRKSLPPLEMTDEQKEHAARLFQELDEKDLNLLNITQIVFENKELTGVSREGRALKKVLGELNLAVSTRTNVVLGDKDLSPEQRKILDSNISTYIKKDMGSLELTRIIFKDDNITNLHQEHRTVVNYLNAAIDGMDGEAYKKIAYIGNPENLPREDYKPPKTLTSTLARINKYVIGNDWKEHNVKSDQRKKADALQRYLNTFSVRQKITSYPKQVYRDTFEDHFVRYTYSKVDLTEEEIDSFLLLCNEKVQEMVLGEQITVMWTLLENQSQEGEGKRISKSLVDAITAARTDANQCQIRQDRLLKNLVQKRADKESALKQDNASILNLVIPWREQEFREKTLHLAIKEHEKLKDEVERLGSLDELTCLIKGVSASEMYGDI